MDRHRSAAIGAGEAGVLFRLKGLFPDLSDSSVVFNKAVLIAVLYVARFQALQMLAGKHLAFVTEVDLMFQKFFTALYDVTALLVPRPAAGAANSHLTGLTI